MYYIRFQTSYILGQVLHMRSCAEWPAHEYYTFHPLNWCPRPLNRGVGLIKVSFTVNKGKKLNWELATVALIKGVRFIEVSLYKAKAMAKLLFIDVKWKLLSDWKPCNASTICISKEPELNFVQFWTYIVALGWFIFTLTAFGKRQI